ncbi:MAG: GGDEF domain-containing protein [Proteobacteria bacterium]|nr:GGDEF domain-containing protein [Pseudomonadota bacterium]
MAVVALPAFATPAATVAAPVTAPAAPGTAATAVLEDGGLNLADSVSVLEDPSQRMSLADVERAARAGRFARTEHDGDDLNFGYRTSALWLQFTITTEQPRLLEVGFPGLDDVRLYAPTAGGGYVETATGDRAPLSSRPILHRHFVFPIAATGGVPATYYMRIASAGTLTVPLTLWSERALALHDRTTYAALALYFGCLLALATYNLLLYFTLRERSYLTYVAFTLSMAIGQASLVGLGNEFVWGRFVGWGDAALPVGFALAGVFGLWFTRDLLALAKVSPTLDRILLVHIAAFAVAVALAGASYRYAALLTSVAGATGAVAAIAAGVVAAIHRQSTARFYLWAWTLMLLGVATLALRNLGLLPTNTFTIYALLFASVVEALLLSFALAYRIVLLTADRERLQREALATARGAEQALETTVAWRTRELALANAELESTLATLERVAATDRLTGAWNRRWFETAAHAEIERATRHATPLSLLLVDLDHFKAVNDRLGHAGGDETLVGVSDLIAENIRGSDSLTRWGGEEFVVLLPQTDLAGASTLAEKLRGLIQHARLPATCPVTASVGVAQYRAGQRLEDFIGAADAALYRAKARGRNCVEAATPAPHLQLATGSGA